MAAKQHTNKSTKKLTIVFFSRLFYPHIGGVEKHVYNISQELMKRGYKVIVVTERYNSHLKKKEVYNGITIYRIPIRENWFKKFFVWFNLFKHQKIIKKADIVHCHDVFYWYLPFKILYPKKKVFTTFHGYEGNSKPSIKAKFMHQLADRLSTGEIAIGSFYTKWYETHPTFTSYGAINHNGILQFEIRKKKKYNAVFIGRLEKETGIMLYLSALNILKTSDISIRLLVLGDGAQKKSAEAFVRKNNLNVKFLGFVNNPQTFVEKADLLFVSRYLAILESLEQKKIVFAVYNNAIKKDYLLETPFAKYINIAGSAKQLVLQINEALRDLPTAKQKSQIGYLWVKGQTWNKLAKLYQTLWQIS